MPPNKFNGHKIVSAKENLLSGKKIDELQIKWVSYDGNIYDSYWKDIDDKPSDDPNKKSKPVILGRVGNEYVILLDVR